METDGKWDDANPWHPITNQLTLKHLGKLGEECNELGAAIFRCIIQGIDEVEPETGKPNRIWLQEEIADVEANLKLVKGHLELDEGAINERMRRKIAHLMGWHAHAEEPPVAYQYEIATAMYQDERKGQPYGCTGWVIRVTAAKDFVPIPPKGQFWPHIRNVRPLR